MPKILTVLLWLILFAMRAQPAAAHAVLLETTPAAGAALDLPPSEILLRFNEPVSPLSIRILTGRSVVEPAGVGAEQSSLRILLPPGLAPDSYIVSYRVVSLDGHPVAGSFTFGVGARPLAAAEPQNAPRQRLWQVLIPANRLVYYASLLAAAGGAWCLAWLLPHSAALRRALYGLSALAAVGALLDLGFNGALLAGTPLTGIATLEPWRTALATTLGPSTAVALLGLMVLLGGLALPGPSPAVLCLGGALSVGSLVLTGHTVTAEPRWLSVPVLAAHALAAAFWLGALGPLLLALHRLGPQQAARVVRRFSGVAGVAVAVLIAAGAILALIQLGGPRVSLRPIYTRLLLVKLVLVILLLGLAARNKWWLTPALETAEPTARARLRAAIGWELGLFAGILLATVGLGQTPPPRMLIEAGRPTLAAAERAAAGTRAYAEAGGYRATVEVTPAVAGPNTLRVQLTSAQGALFTPLQATLRLAQPQAGIEPSVSPMIIAGPGVLEIDGAQFPIPGRWTVWIDILVSDFEQRTFTLEVNIGPAG